jgi:hypothetical protein
VKNANARDINADYKYPQKFTWQEDYGVYCKSCGKSIDFEFTLGLKVWAIGQ